MRLDQPWPWRMLASGEFEDAWTTGTQDEREGAYVRLIALHRDWQALGARMICTMDNLGSAGRPGASHANFYELWEIPTPELAHDLLDAVWSTQSGPPLTKHFSLRITIGKPIISIERDLGGPQQATMATAAGEMPPV